MRCYLMYVIFIGFGQTYAEPVVSCRIQTCKVVPSTLSNHSAYQKVNK